MTKLSDEKLLEELEKRFTANKKALEELKSITKQLKTVNKKLGESEALKTHFLSNITNEIVNPFASILGLSKNILSIKEGEWQRVKSMAALIHAEAFSLDFQLKNIFAAAKIEGGELMPEIVNVDINQLVENVIETYKYHAEQKQLSIEFHYEISAKLKKMYYFKTDPEKLKIMLSNLLSNGIKFSNAANRIEIKVWLQDDKLSFSIKDFGRGIKKEDLQVIFDRFKRIDSNINSLNTGHGLGLSIVKAMADLLNGSIEIQSTVNKGSVFTLTVPEGTSVSDHTFASDDNEFFFDEDEVF